MAADGARANSETERDPGLWADDPPPMLRIDPDDPRFIRPLKEGEEPPFEGMIDLTTSAPPDANVRVWRGFGPFSSLSRRIVSFNIIGLGLLVAGVLYLNQFRAGLIDQRIQSLQVQGEIIAIAIAENAGLGPEELRYDPVRANVVLRRLTAPTRVRAQIFDRQGRLTGDTRSIAAGGGPIDVKPLPPPGEPAPDKTLLDRVEHIYDWLFSKLLGARPVYEETVASVLASEKDAEVAAALAGWTRRAERINSEGEQIVSVAVPIQRFRAVIGALVLSTEGGDIDEIVRSERRSIVQMFLVALAVSVTLSVVLANTIAKPIRKLAEAAERGGARESRLLNPGRIQIPDLTGRPDEIGYLSGALRAMTAALYDRIEAIESFAADVSHEIKNPLTSLRSAVETMRLARNDEMRARLMKVIEKDVMRLDRLVTDISNASRLDAELVREEMEPFDLTELLANLCEFNSAKAEERGGRIEPDLPQGRMEVRGLEGRLAQVFVNLIANAISFTPEGGSVRVRARRTSEGLVRVTVEDDGPGIPEENLASVFQRFYSERPDTEEFGEHSGLGLSISRQIVEAHGGRLWAENIRPEGADAETLPDGARFVVELPQ